jgi:hypothetical protein
MQDIWVSLHSVHSRSTLFSFIVHRPRTSQLHLRHHRRLLHSTHLSRPCWVPSDTGHCCLSPLRGWHTSKSLPEVGSARPLESYARRSGCLYTLFDQDHDLVFFSFWSIKPAMLPTSMLGDYSMSASWTPSCFSRRTDLLGNLFLIASLLDLLFSLLLFLDHHTGHPARHDARILLMSASSMPSKFFHRRFL